MGEGPCDLRAVTLEFRTRASKIVRSVQIRLLIPDRSMRPRGPHRSYPLPTTARSRRRAHTDTHTQGSRRGLPGYGQHVCSTRIMASFSAWVTHSRYKALTVI